MRFTLGTARVTYLNFPHQCVENEVADFAHFGRVRVIRYRGEFGMVKMLNDEDHMLYNHIVQVDV